MKTSLARFIAIILCLMLLPFGAFSNEAPEGAAPAPAAASTPAPEAASTPAPVAVTTPAPAAVTTPAPAAVTTPAPAAATTPAPAAASTPAPAAVTTPAPAAVSTPAPEAVSTPAPVAATTPAPAAASAPDNTNQPEALDLNNEKPALANLQSSTTTVELSPTNDSQVNGSSVNENKGSAASIVIKNSFDKTKNQMVDRFGFMQFDLSGISGRIESATLRLTRVSGSGASPLMISLVENADFSKNWSESDITYANSVTKYNLQPLALRLITLDTTPVNNTTSATKSYDVSLGAQIIQASSSFEGKLTLCIFHGPDDTGAYPAVGCDFASKENGTEAYRPKLTVNVTNDQNMIKAIDDRVWVASQIPAQTTENLTLPTDGVNGSVIEWYSSDESIIMTDGTVNRPSYISGDKTVVLTASIKNGDKLTQQAFRITVKCKEVTDEERVDCDIQYIKNILDNITVVSDVSFPQNAELQAKSFGSTVVYSSSDPAHLTNDGKVTRPAANEKTAVVKLTATVKYGTVEKSAVLTIYVQKVQTDIAQYVREDLGNIIAHAKELITKPNHIDGSKLVVDPKLVFDGCNIPSGDVVGTEWGQYPQSAVDIFSQAIKSAEDVYNNTSYDSATYVLAAKTLIAAGSDFIRSANLSNEVLIKNKQMHKLAFSEYRRDLMAYLWEAETTLMLEDHFYPKSAKEALQIEIDNSKKVLDYAYAEPFVRTSGLMTIDPDHHIQFAAKHYARRKTDDGLEASLQEGLVPTLEWYKKQHILADAYEVVQVKPTDDTYIKSDGSDVSKVFGNDTGIIIGKSRVAGFFKFNLKDYLDVSKAGATFNIWHYNSGGVEYQLYYMTDESMKGWSEKTLTYNLFQSTKSKEINQNQYIASFQAPTGASASNQRKYTVDILSALNKKFAEANDNGVITLIVAFDTSVYGSGGTKEAASDFRSKEYLSGAYAPYIELKLNNVPMQSLIKKYNFVMGKAQELLAKTKDGKNVGDGVGNYPQKYVDALVAAMNNAKAKIEDGDSNQVGIALIEVYDAMRDMSDHQVLRTDIDPNSTMFFTPEEKLEIAKKITSMPNLAEFYNEKKAVADSKKLSDFQDRMFFLDPNMTYETLSKYYSTFTLRREGSWEFNAESPSNAAYATLEISLPAANNEEDAAVYNQAQMEKAGGYLPATRTGHVWVDDVAFDDPNGVSVLGENNNGGFEYVSSSSGMPAANWDNISKGSPVVRREFMGYRRTGAASMFLKNNNANDEAVIKYVYDPTKSADDPKRYLIPVRPSTKYALNFATKQDGELVGFNGYCRLATSGTTMTVKFYDANGNQVGSPVTGYLNKVSRANNRAEHSDAIAYLVTGDKTYAQKVKLGLLTGFNEFCESAEVRMTYEKGRGNDARDEVQAGRFLAMTMATYSLIEDANVFTDEEFDKFVKMVQYIVDYCTNTRDQTIYDDSTIAATGNWETDMYIGAALAAMALRKPDPDNPGHMKSVIRNSKQIIDNAAWLVTKQMDMSIANSGAYSESIRYLWAAYSRVTTAARAFKVNLNDNWYEYTKLPLIFEFAVQVQTPPYEYLNNRISSPNYGDCLITEGPAGMALLGQYAPDVAAANPTLGMQMLETWKKAGKPIGVDNEGALISAFFVPLDIENHDNIPLDLVSTDYYHQKSPIILRNNQSRSNETYLCVISSTDDLNHGHEDQGSFTIMSNGSYLVADPGVENYWDTTTKERYLSSSNHSTLTFYKGGVTPSYVNEDMNNHIQTGVNANETGVSKLKESYFSDSIDKLKIEIAIDNKNCGGGTHYRNLAFVKNGIEAVIIWDQVKNNMSNITQFNLPTVAVQTQISGNKVKTIGHYKMDMETTVLLPRDASIVYDTMRAANLAPYVGDREFSSVDVIRVIAKRPGENHLTVLYPMKKGAPGLTTTEIATSNPNVVAFEIKTAYGNSVIAVANNSSGTQRINIGSGLINMETNEAFNGDVKGNSLLILKRDTLERPKPAVLELSGPAFIQRPNSGISLKYNYQAMLIDQYNNKMTGLNKELEIKEYVKPAQLPATNRPDGVPSDVVFNSPHPMTIGVPKVNWSLASDVQGAKISQDGILTIDRNINVDKLTIVATSNGISNTYDVTVGSAVTSFPDRMEITGPLVIGVTPDKGMAVKYGYKVYDQFGAEVPVSGINWAITMKNAIPGIEINKDGELSISPAAAKAIADAGMATVTIKANSKTNARLKDVRSVVVLRSTPSGVRTHFNSKIQVPEQGTAKVKLTGEIINQNGTALNDAGTITWEIYGQDLPEGLSINGDELIVPAGINGVSFEIGAVARLKDGSTIKEIIPVTATTDRVASSLVISGSNTVVADSKTAKTVNYSTVVYDQLGQQMNDAQIKWSAQSSLSGVVFNVRTGTLTVQPNAQTGTFTIKAVSDKGLEAAYDINIIGNASNVKDSDSGSSGGSGGGGGAIGSSAGLPAQPAEPVQQFADVGKDYWGYEYIQSLAFEGKLKGNANKLFNPDANITRAEFMQMIVNILGMTSADNVPSFSDVSEGDWYFKAVAIGSEKGFINGYDGKFKPNDNISRQDMAVIVKRVFDYYKLSIGEKGEKITFTDEAEIADYARDAVKFAQAAGIISGYSDGSFKPQNNATRGESAKIMYFVNKLISK